MNNVILTPAIVAALVSDCLGTVKVLGIVGRCRTGKTLSLKQWTEETRAQDGLRVAYADSQTLLMSEKVEVDFEGKVRGATVGHYPMFDFNGADIVVVDEPLQNRELVERLFAHVDPSGGAFMHRLMVLPLQTEDSIERFGIPRSAVRLYSVAGLPL
ncbi:MULTISPECIES: hypothetical protein [Cupriavidus]|uniref:Uncharacterized protein n=1 Tax=Cupriavidus basilensis TaxID=68895 RepID=A0A643FSF7_9BURK|nr:MULTISPECIES: hypothetical protein [Cupriavidus]NOV23559.1 hypothetical protein [Cupriavidus necator]QOT81634.1 hypothetical protein F7R26_037095 [Cupriavidus basilensis]BDB30155.1 hypothetical protein CTP10_R75720 [Cupriavidus sp. P-10]